VLRTSLALVVSASFAACSSSPTSPTVVTSVSGVWSGAVARADGGTGQLRLDLREVPAGGVSVVSGSYEARLAEGTTTGTVIGASGDGETALALQPSQPLACPGSSAPQAGQISLRLRVESRRLSGEAVLTMCGGFDASTVSLNRQ